MNCKSFFLVPTQAPVLTMAKNVSSTSLHLEWQVLDEVSFQGRPLGYTLYYRIKNTTVFYNQLIDGHLCTNTTISGLMKYTHYELFMTARTKKGEGIKGEFMNLTTDEDGKGHAMIILLFIKEIKNFMLCGNGNIYTFMGQLFV